MSDFCATCITGHGPFVTRNGFCLCLDRTDRPAIPRRHLTTKRLRTRAQDRRALLRAANRCINGPMHDGPGRKYGVVHGPVVSGGKCQHCIETHAKTSSRRAA